MVYYKMSNHANQRFSILAGEGTETVILTLRWVPSISRWVAGIEGICDGVAVVPNVPIFQQYGYKNIFFIDRNSREIGRLVDQTYIIVATRQEVGGLMYPVLEETRNGVRLVANE